MTEFNDYNHKELDDKLLEILEKSADHQYQNGDPDFVEQEAITQIHKAFTEAGWMKLDKLKLEMYNAMENLEVGIRREGGTMTGQEWLSRYFKEWNKLKLSGSTDFADGLEAAKKASGL